MEWGIGGDGIRWDEVWLSHKFGDGFRDNESGVNEFGEAFFDIRAVCIFGKFFSGGEW